MHVKRKQKKLLDRVSRIRGQVDAIHRAIEKEEECARVLNVMAACRGAMTSLMSEVLEEHVMTHVADEADAKQRQEAAEEIIAVLRSYVR